MSNHSVLHLDQEKPLAPYIPEYTIDQVTGYATTEDGQTCVLRTLTADGNEVRLLVQTVNIEVIIGALRAAKMAAAAKTQVTEAGKANVFMPQKYETITTDSFNGVLLAFDRGEASEIIIGLDADAAFNMGQNLRKQVRAQNKLILPERQIQ